MFGFAKKISTDSLAVKNILSRGVEEIFVRESLEKKLLSGKSFRIKLGFDPTGPKIHIGRAIILRKLLEFQKLGHTAVFVVGDFTARIGDPSDKLERRPMLSNEKIEANLKTYKEQVAKILDIKKAEFHYNSKWLSKLNFGEVAELAESFSIQQMTARRNFKERIEKGEAVSLRETLYPLMQGYDSVAVKADIEIGGFDQLFNLKAGRVIQRQYGQVEQDVLTTTMLEGADGRKMSTSWGNIISVVDEPADMFGKIMSVRDELIVKYFMLCTNTPEEEVSKLESNIKSGLSNPRDAKLRLAREIVSLYHNANEAKEAEEKFLATFTRAEFPSDVEVRKIKHGALLINAVSDIAGSKSEFVRLINEGAVFDFKTNSKISDRKTAIISDMDLRIGKRRFVRIVVVA